LIDRIMSHNNSPNVFSNILKIYHNENYLDLNSYGFSVMITASS